MRNICTILYLLFPAMLGAHEGVPFFRNYSSAEYGGHNRNFDVVSGKDGITYFANFEGVLSFDNTTWRILYTPGYSRITRLFRDSKGNLWAGGYNIMAKVVTDENRRTVLRPLVSDAGSSKIGEIEDLFEEDGKVYCYIREKGHYEVSGNILRKVSDSMYVMDYDRSSTMVYVKGLGEVEVSHSIRLRNGWQVLATQKQGLIVLDSKGNKLCALTEANGLCSNSISRIAESENGCVWGVTDNGIFRVYLPSMFDHYTSAENLKGEVTTIQKHNSHLYIGTLRGLYVADDDRVIRLPSITQACWQLVLSNENKLYAATSEGVFGIEDGNLHQISEDHTLSLACESSGHYLYAGEMDGIFKLTLKGGKAEPVKVSEVDKVIRFSWDASGGLIAESLLGDYYYKNREGDEFIQLEKLPEVDNVTDSVVWKNERLAALKEKTLRAIYSESDSVIWFGGDFGAIRVNLFAEDASFSHLPQVFIREVRLNGDSIYFGGNYFEEDWDGEGRYLKTPAFASDTKNISFWFSSDALSLHRKVEYQYMLEGYDDAWSAWTDVPKKTYANLFYGSYKFKVRARDSFGRCSAGKEYPFTILLPFYLKWYSLLIYILLFAALVYGAVRWRLRKLVKEKEALEKIVDSRTRQLRDAQADLVRQEKMATVGKLTKGLIDRILNPLNYINNFSHLSSGLVKDLRKNLDFAKECMSRDDYEDSVDILDMMASNLQKIEAHGGNTSRVLKAMEEVLKDRNKQKARMNIIGLCRKSLDMLSVYYKEDIERMRISVLADFPSETLMIQGNEEQLGKTFMSLLNNGMYAISKKYAKHPYPPRIGISVKIEDETILLSIRDDGIGIEESIREQIFDPFFTTKTTGEAAGVGLYLSREIIANHNGTIHVDSCKDEYTEFIIKLPIE